MAVGPHASAVAAEPAVVFGLPVRHLRGLPQVPHSGLNDDCCRENLALIADTSLSGARVARELDALVRIYGKPACVVSDRRGSENDPGDRFPEEGHRVHQQGDPEVD